MVSEERLQFNLQHMKRMLGYSAEGMENPVTIQDKLRWLNIYDADPLKSECADKLKVKDYARKITGVDLGVPNIAVWNKVEDIDFSLLPDKFVLKCNHGSGMNIIVKNKSQFNQVDALNKLRQWMNEDFAFRNGFESHYHWIQRKIFAEEYIEVDGQDDIPDYKFMCFNGIPTYMQVISDRNNSNKRLNYYDMNMQKCSLSQINMKANYNIDDILPIRFDLMKQYASLLSRDFKFVRVDFYEVKGRIYLGEMTFTPAAFLFRYVNAEDEIKDGKLLTL